MIASLSSDAVTTEGRYSTMTSFVARLAFAATTPSFSSSPSSSAFMHDAHLMSST